MSDDLLQTKLHVPRLRPSLVPRPRLIEALNQGLAGKLTLISAAAGFGKTTLVSSWIDARQTERAAPPSRWARESRLGAVLQTGNIARKTGREASRECNCA